MGSLRASSRAVTILLRMATSVPPGFSDVSPEICSAVVLPCLSLLKGHITGGTSGQKLRWPRDVWESCHLSLLSVPRFTALAVGSMWKMARW